MTTKNSAKLSAQSSDRTSEPVPQLTLSFLESKPQSAASSLNKLPVEDAAVLLESIPAKISVDIFSHLDAWPASLILAKMNSASAAAILEQLDYQNTIAIMRLTRAESRAVLLDTLPENLKRSFQASLRFAQDTVGAHMTTSVLSMTGEQTVADALQQSRQSQLPEVNSIFIIDAARKLEGVVASGALLRSDPTARLADIMDTTVPTLYTRARLSTAVSAIAWDEHSQLPVVSRHQHLIGALPRKSARSDAHFLAANPISSSSILGLIGNAFSISVIGLAELLADSITSNSQDSRSQHSASMRNRS